MKEENPDIQSVVILALETDSAQIESAKALEEYSESIGLTVLDIIYIDMDQEEGMCAVVQALNARADGYISLVRAEEYGMLLTELRKRGISEGRRILASFSGFEYDMMESHREALAGTYIWNGVNLDIEGEEWQALVKDYQAAMTERVRTAVLWLICIMRCLPGNNVWKS